MNYTPANLWTIVQMDPKPEPEPQLVELTKDLRVPADWTKERRSEFLLKWTFRQTPV